MDIVFLCGIVVTIATAIPVVLQLRRHPRGLLILFFTEMWERFSYYGMRGLLVFYLTQHFLFTDQRAAAQYGSYATLVYLLPVVGGVLADRYLGARKAVAFGALLLVAGHATMAIEGPPAHQSLVYHGQRFAVAPDDKGKGERAAPSVTLDGRAVTFQQTPTGDLDIVGAKPGEALPAHIARGDFTFETARAPGPFENVLYLALALIIMGVGFLKANISAIVGKLYEAHDPRRDPGFTLYYYGINLGAFWAAILCGYLGQRFGWSWGFGAAGVGMAAGFLTFVLGRPLLQGRGEPPDPERLRRKVLGPLSLEYTIY